MFTFIAYFELLLIKYWFYDIYLSILPYNIEIRQNFYYSRVQNSQSLEEQQDQLLDHFYVIETHNEYHWEPSSVAQNYSIIWNSVSSNSTDDSFAE